MGTTFDEDMKLMLHCLFCDEKGKSLSFLEGVLSGAEKMLFFFVGKLTTSVQLIENIK